MIDVREELSNSPTLSLCMIVRNEEKFLPQCLESAKGVVDEMVIVDTGSTDRTVEIAKSYGAKVYHHPWQDSFSEARNYGLKFAAGDWILQLDADEELEQADIPLLRNVLRSSSYNAVFVAIYNRFPDGTSKHYFQRIFRRDKGHYEGIVHNQLVHEGEALASEIRVYHYGYDLDPEKMEQKYRRTSVLLQKQIEEDFEDMFARENLVRIYRCWKKFDKAVEEGEKAMALDTPKMTSARRQMILYDTAYSLFVLRQYEKAEEYCLRVLEENPRNLDAQFVLGSVYTATGRRPEALGAYMRFLEIKNQEKVCPRYTPLQVDTYTYEDKVWNNIGGSYRDMGLFDEAIDAYQQAIEINGRSPIFYRNLAHCCIQENRLERAQDALREVIRLDPDDIGSLLNLTHVESKMGKREEALEHLDQIMAMNLESGQTQETEIRIRDIPPNSIRRQASSAKYKPDLYLSLISVCIALGEYGRAIELLEGHLKFAPTDHRVLNDLATCYFRLGHYEAALVGYRAALKLNPGYEQAIRNLTVLQRRLGRGGEDNKIPGIHGAGGSLSPTG